MHRQKSSTYLLIRCYQKLQQPGQPHLIFRALNFRIMATNARLIILLKNILEIGEGVDVITDPGPGRRKPLNKIADSGMNIAVQNNPMRHDKDDLANGQHNSGRYPPLAAKGVFFGVEGEGCSQAEHNL